VKLLMENWRAYLSEAQTSDIYGNLYLFEDDTVSKTSFYDAINMLSESDEDTATFLENWERSVDHMFGSLDEAVPIETGVQGVDDAILKASTQAYMALNKMKGKAFGSVLNVVGKMKGFAEKNPKTTKAAVFVGQVLIAAAVTTAAIHVVEGNTNDMEGMQDTLGDIMKAAARAKEDLFDIMQDLDTVPNQAKDFTVDYIAPKGWEQEFGDWGRWLNPEELAQRAQEVEKMGDQVSQAIGDSSLEQAMSGWEDGMENAIEQLPDIAEPGSGGFEQTIEDIKSATTSEEFMDILKRGETPSTKSLQDLARQIESGEFDGEGRKALRDLIKQMPAGPEKKQLRGFIRARDSAKVIKTIFNVTPHGALVNIIDKLDTGEKIIRTATDGSDFAGRVAKGVTKLGRSLE
jgi:hypothetical protein